MMSLGSGRLDDVTELRSPSWKGCPRQGLERQRMIGVFIRVFHIRSGERSRNSPTLGGHCALDVNAASQHWTYASGGENGRRRPAARRLQFGLLTPTDPRGTARAFGMAFSHFIKRDRRMCRRGQSPVLQSYVGPPTDLPAVPRRLHLAGRGHPPSRGLPAPAAALGPPGRSSSLQ
jgi:hypothetical protein